MTAPDDPENEDLEDAVFEPREGEKADVEGIVSGFTQHPGTFLVGTQTVETTSGTRIRGGILADGARVEAQGTVTGGILVAEEIDIR